MKSMIVILSCLLLLVGNVIAGSPDVSHPVMRELFEPFVEALKNVPPGEDGIIVVENEQAGCGALYDTDVNGIIVFEGGNVAIYWIYSGQVEIFEYTMFGWMPTVIPKEVLEENIKRIYDILFKPGVPI